MQRVKDYAGFGVWFLGLSYIVMFATGGADAHPALNAPAVRLIGTLAAIAVFVRLLLIAVRSTKRRPDDSLKPARRLRKPQPTVKRIKSRDHFGLRGL